MDREVSTPILVADDSDDDVLLLKLVMQQAGVLNPIVVARSGEEAIAYLKELPGGASSGTRLPRIVFLDVRMPQKDGLQVLKWIKEQPHLSDVLAVMLSHYGEIGTVKRAYDLGAYSFLSKPFLLRDLEHLIKHTRVCWAIAPKSPEGLVKSENQTPGVVA